MDGHNKDEHREHKNINASIKNLEKSTAFLNKKVVNYRDSAFSKFPIVFVLLSAFGLVATFYGFEKVIDQIDFFNKYPAMILLTGIIVLVATGTLFKKLK